MQDKAHQLKFQEHSPRELSERSNLKLLPEETLNNLNIILIICRLGFDMHSGVHRRQRTGD